MPNKNVKGKLVATGELSRDDRSLLRSIYDTIKSQSERIEEAKRVSEDLECQVLDEVKRIVIENRAVEPNDIVRDDLGNLWRISKITYDRNGFLSKINNVSPNNYKYNSCGEKELAEKDLDSILSFTVYGWRLHIRSLIPAHKDQQIIHSKTLELIDVKDLEKES